MSNTGNRWRSRRRMAATWLSLGAVVGCTTDGDLTQTGDAGPMPVDGAAQHDEHDGKVERPDHEPDAASGNDAGPQLPGGWWDPAFTKRRRLTLNANDADRVLQNLPVLVRLPVDLVSQDQVKADGSHLRFVDGQGTVLKHEIDTWSETQAAVWVRVPEVGSLADTGFYLYYGHASAQALPGEHAQDVWDEAFAGVWHFSGDASDSTRHVYDGVHTVGSFGEGSIGQALQLDRDAQGHVRLANDIAFVAGAEGATVSAWVKHSGGGNGDQEIILGVGTDSADGHLSRISVALSPELGLIGEINPDQAGWELTKSEANTVGADAWRHIAVVMSVVDKSIALYVDGARVQDPYSGHWNAAQFPSTPSNRVVVGGEEDISKSFFNGLIEELRVETTARDGTFISAAVRAGGADYVTVGSEESIAP